MLEQMGMSNRTKDREMIISIFRTTNYSREEFFTLMGKIESDSFVDKICDFSVGNWIIVHAHSCFNDVQFDDERVELWSSTHM